LPQLIQASDEALLNYISTNLMENGLLVAFFLPLFLAFFYRVPTYMVWMISNFAQVMEILSFLRIQLPGNVIQISLGLEDFIHMNKPFGPDLLYNAIYGPIYGPYTYETNNLK
jgi:hypothetical protein